MNTDFNTAQQMSDLNSSPCDITNNEWESCSEFLKQKLENTRIFEKNSIYVIGIPQMYCIPELLKSKMYFGQYGNILSIEIKRRAYFCGEDHSTHYSAYIRFSHENEA